MPPPLRRLVPPWGQPQCTRAAYAIRIRPVLRRKRWYWEYLVRPGDFDRSGLIIRLALREGRAMTSENAIPIAIIGAGVDAGSVAPLFRKCPRNFAGSLLPAPAAPPLRAYPTRENE